MYQAPVEPCLIAYVLCRSVGFGQQTRNPEK